MGVYTGREPGLGVNRRTRSASLARALSIAVVAGALSAFVVGGVVGRAAMRLLAMTSPPAAQGGITDDQAIVGEVTLGGTLGLAAFVSLLGVIGGLVYVWVRRVLPASFRWRVIGFGVFAGSIGGAFFVHDHPSFDYTILTPDWLTVGTFVTLPLLFGMLVAAAIETAEKPGALPQRAPWVVLVICGLTFALPTLVVTGPAIIMSFVVINVPSLHRVWRSRLVTLTGAVLYAVLIIWGTYGLVADIISITTDQPSTAPLNP
jgi:hypothetical protein